MNESTPRPRAALFSLEPLENRQLLSVSLDANGWTNLTPSPDTRTIYVSSSTGSDANNGLSSSTPLQTIAKAKSLMRDGMPDWLLLKRGDTWHESLGVWTLSGRSADQPLLVSSYGSGARPILATGSDSGLDTQGDANSVAFIGLDFYADTRDPNSPDYDPTVDPNQTGFRWLAPTNSLLIEDCNFSFYGTNIILQQYGGPIQNVTLRRNNILDSYSTTVHSQGLYAYGIQGLRIEDNLFDHNGWNEQIPGAEATVFNHNIYLSSGNTDTVITGNVIADASATGIKAGSGGDIQDNLFLRNPIGISYGTLTEIDPNGTWGDISGNVFLDGRDIAGSPRGYAIAIGNIAPGKGTSIHDNIFAHDTQLANPAIIVSPDKITRGVGVNDLTIANNIVYNWFSGFRISEGFIPGGVGGNALNNLVVRDNDFQHTLSRNVGDHAILFDPAQEHWSGNRYFSTSLDSAWFRLGPLYTATSFSLWQAIVDPTCEARQIDYPDPDRDMATYNASLGGVASVDAFLAQMRLQSRQNYRKEYTARSAISYMQAGFYQVGDVNLDGGVTIADFITVSSNFGKTDQDWSAGDFNGDGLVSISDLIDLASNYNVLS